MESIEIEKDLQTITDALQFELEEPRFCLSIMVYESRQMKLKQFTNTEWSMEEKDNMIYFFYENLVKSSDLYMLLRSYLEYSSDTDTDIHDTNKLDQPAIIDGYQLLKAINNRDCGGTISKKWAETLIHILTKIKQNGNIRLESRYMKLKCTLESCVKYLYPNEYRIGFTNEEAFLNDTNTNAKDYRPIFKLPDGWEPRKHPSTRRTQRVYWADHNTNTTHWNPPTLPPLPIK